MTSTSLPPHPPRAGNAPPYEAAMLAHDIRNALNGVTGGIALLDRGRMEPELGPQVDRIAAAGEQLERLVSVLLGEAGGPVHGAPVATAPTPLHALCSTIARRWTGEAAARSLELRIETGPDLPAALRVAAIDLLRVLGNLINNAIKFSGGRTVRLGIDRAADGGITLTVSDDGRGIQGRDPQDLLASGDRPDGQGLGLHIARTLTAAMGGNLRLGNLPTGGLEAVVQLPAALAASEDEAATSGNAVAGIAGARILLAEDNRATGLVTRELLASLGAEVMLATDGFEALALLERETFDAVILDLEMPRVSGLDVIRAIRSASGPEGATPLIVLSGHVSPEDRARAIEAGADDLIPKPVREADMLGQAIARCMRRERPPAGAPSEGTDPVIDHAIFESLADTIGREMMSELLDRIESDLATARDALAAAIDPVEVTAIQASSHILISVAGTFGATRLRHAAAALNSAARENGDPTLAPQVHECLAEIAAALDFVRTQRTAC